eukprot:Nitzschia sp. Nitz4//scaffold294_size23022//3646//4665//NITZ4_008512-RA/size23022-processed-gene-0.19-mRNA-1//1//CDS//3329546217//1275//frame0
MIKQEENAYDYLSYFPDMSDEELEHRCHLNYSWREKICKWSYNVVDHFDLPREVVAISLDIFDRFLATQENKCSGNIALLVSLTTLHLSIKIHSDKAISLTTLASLSRGQFTTRDIELMERQILDALAWKLHPPTVYAHVSHLLMLLPVEIHESVRKDIFQAAVYISELIVCDSFFVRIPSSSIALAAISIVMEELSPARFPLRSRDAFWRDLTHNITGFQGPCIMKVRDRLRSMFSSVANSGVLGRTDSFLSTGSHGSDSGITGSPTSVTAMQIDDSTSMASTTRASEQVPGAHRKAPPSHKKPTTSTNASSQRYAGPVTRTNTGIASSPIWTGVSRP